MIIKKCSYIRFYLVVKQLFLFFCFISLLGGTLSAHDYTAGSRLLDEPADSVFGDVRINEVMANPTGLTAFPVSEYVELYNASNTDINLKDWTFIYDERVSMTLPDTILPVGGYAVLHRSAKTIYVDIGGIAIPLTTFPSTPANAGRKLELTNSLGVLIDSVTYKAATAGCSWERDAAGNFYLSYDPRGGTPGSDNSVKPPDYSQYGDIRINEIMANPTGLTAFPVSEYVELYNASNTDINLKDWTFIYDERVFMKLPDVLLPVDGYAVLHRNTKTLYIDAGGIAIPLTTFPSTLANAGRKLELTNSWDVLIDSVTYQVATAGCSWERDAADNFYLSYDPRGGTPGSVNSVKPPDYSQYGDVRINEIMVDPRELSDFPETEYVELYNASNTDINLKDWTLIYDERVSMKLPDVLLPIGGYAVLHRNTKTIVVDQGGIAISLSTFPSTLANAGRKLELTNSWDVLIDSVTYKAATAGCSWECDAAGNMYLSYDPRGGTPGSVNSVRPPDYSRYGDVRINEIMVDPRGLTDFPETEYVELYNASKSVINLKDWTLIYDERVSMKLPDILLPVGGYAVLHRNDKTIDIAQGGIAIPLSTFPSTLANTGRKLELTNSWDVLIDSITYKAATGACSWERDAAGNLYLSYDPRGGTPGSVNSVKPPDYSRYGDVRINEIMADPRNLYAFPETEYIELYNASNSSINLKDWTLIYDERVSMKLPDVLLPVGGYAVLHRNTKTIYIAQGGIDIPLTTFPSTLANTGRKLTLINSWDVLIDSITYKTAETGCSWERDVAGNLYLSYDPRGGTPGAVNSVRPPDYSRYGDIRINEIMADPRGLTSFPETEYIELYNTSNSDINLKRWAFIYDERVRLVLPDIILPVGGYAILYREGKEIYVDAGGIMIPLATFPSTLANAGRKLELTNSWDILIDSLTYSAAKSAQSWERDTEGNLYLSSDPRGGTPGSANSSKGLPGRPDYSQWGDVLINEIMANPNGLTAFPETEYVELYNASNSAINLKGWSFMYDIRAIEIPDAILPIHGYAVLYRAGNEIYIDNGGTAIPIATFPAALANTGRYLQLNNSAEILIDSITYQTAKAGCSWERDTEGNLYLSNDPRGGTPGSVNSPKELPSDPDVPDDTDDTDDPDDSHYGDVRINEIMADPAGLTAFPETEYIELYNVSETGINLRGWSLIYDTRTITIPDAILPVDGYAVLFRAGNDIYLDEGGLAIPIATFPAALANTGRYVAIKNSKGTLIDSVTYKTAVAARAYERDPDGSLYLSNNPRGGTPGSANSSRYNPDDPMESSLFVDPKEWIFNELLPEQKEGGSEYIELYNRSNRPLFLSGLSIATRRADGTLSTRYSLSSIQEAFPPGDYIVLTSNRDGVLDFFYTPAPHNVYELRLPALNNTGATLVLFRTNDESTIDEVGYSDKWHDPFIRNLKGVALERIHPDEDTQNPSNWISATSEVGYGTPGYQNSQHRTLETREVIQIGIPEYRDGYGDYVIRYQTDKSGYHCRMEVYSLEGNKVAEISNNQLIGFEGEINWTGEGMDGSRLRPGLYIFYTEIFHPDGLRKNYKNVFLMKP